MDILIAVAIGIGIILTLVPVFILIGKYVDWVAKKMGL